mgnify:CR=1 FL=1
MFVKFKGTIVNKLRIVHFESKELYKDFLDKYYGKNFFYSDGTTYKQALNFYNSYESNFCVWINKYDKQRCSLSFGSLPYARMNYSSTNIEEYTLDNDNNNNKLEIE